MFTLLEFPLARLGSICLPHMTPAERMNCNIAFAIPYGRFA